MDDTNAGLPTDKSPLIQALRGAPLWNHAADIDLADNVLRQATMLPRRTRTPRLMVSIAAVALLAGGISMLAWALDCLPARQGGDMASAKSASDEFFILNTDASTGAALLQSLKDFSVEWKRPGDDAGRYRIESIESDGITVTEKNNRPVLLISAAHNVEASGLLAEEVAALRARIASDALTIDQLHRLESIAYFNIADSRTLLDKALTSPAALAKLTDAATLHERHRSLRRMQWYALNGTPRERMQAVSALAKSDSPQALQTLKDAALGDDAAAANSAVLALSLSKNPLKMNALREIADSESATDAIRRKAGFEIAALRNPMDTK